MKRSFFKFLPQRDNDPATGGDEAAVLTRQALASAHPRLPPCRSEGVETLLSRVMPETYRTPNAGAGDVKIARFQSGACPWINVKQS